MKYLTLWFKGLWDLFVGLMWKGLKLQARKSLDRYMQSLMGHLGRNLEAHDAQKKRGQGRQIVRIQKEARSFRVERELCREVGRGHSYSILAKTLATFYPCLRVNSTVINQII